MTSDRTVSVLLKAQVDGFVSNFKKAEVATKSLRDRTDEVVKSHKMMAIAAETVGAIGAVAIGKKLVGAASDLNETMSKTQVVFGSSADAVLEWSKTTAESIGMSRQQAAEAAATFGNLFVALKIGPKVASDMSTKLVTLAGDLASFNNVDPAEALDALRSGLVGETEPLRKFGVNMNAATLQAEAMKLGLIDHKVNALDPAIQAQAAYALILEQTKTAQGDFARTSDGLANSQRRFTAEVANAEAGLGQLLLPAVNTGVHLLTDLLGVFNAIPEPIRGVVVVGGAFSALLVVLAPRIVATKQAMNDLGVSGGGIAKGLGKAAIALAAFEAAGAAINHFTDAAANAGQGSNELADTLSKMGQKGVVDVGLGFKVAEGDTRSFTDALFLAADNHGWDQLGTSIAGIAGVDTTFSLAQKSIEGVDGALAGLVSSGRGGDAAAAFRVLSDSFAAQGGDVSKLNALFPKYRDAVKGASSATSDLAGTTDTAATSVDALKKSIDVLRGTQITADEATSNLEAAIEGVTKAAKENSGALRMHHGQLDLSSAKAQAADASLRSLASTALDGVQAWAANGAGAKQVAAKTQEARDAFVEAAGKMGLGTKAANRLADAYGLIPTKIATTVTSSTQTAQQRLNVLLATLNALRQKVQIDVRAGTQGTGGGRTAGNAIGGKIVGPGTSTSDSITRNVSNGEWVIRAAAASKYGDRTMAAINAGTWSPPAFATTPVQAASGSVMPMLVAGNGVPVVLQLDGQAVVTAILRVKRSRGGVSLGIA